MATYSANGSGSQFFNYMHARVEVTRTDYSTYSAFSVVCKVVSDGGSSSFISGRATASSSGSYGSYSSEQSVSAYGTTTLKTQTFNVTRGTSSKTLACKASILGGGTGMYAGKYDEASVNVTIPAISYDVPNAPSSLTATYVSDSSATLSWTNGSTTTTKPRTATVVERQTDGGAWAQVASVSASSTSYTDNGIEANHSYAYRVAAQNSVGLSTYATSSAIYTTPAAPASVTLDKTSATAVTVDVTGSMPYATGYDVQSTYDNGATWQTDATGVSMPYAATVGAGTVIFRVRSTRGALESAWTQSAALVTITPPLAPTITASPANPTSYGDSVTITWTPNHPDGSAQDHAEVKVTDPGGTSTTYTVAGTTTTYTFTPGSTGSWTAQVRTKGLDATMGAWSSTVSWTVANPPAVAITAPATDGTVISSLPLSVAWTVTDGTGVSAQRMIIEDVGGTEIFNRTLAANATSASLTASDVALVNGESYAIKLRVMGGSGLVTVQTRTFQVSWTAPAEPMLAIYEGDGSSASIDVILPSSSGSGETVEFSEGGIVTSLSIEGKSVQEGTPSPSEPVAIESVESYNLSPFFSQAFSDTSYWSSVNAAYTKLDDGWAHVVSDRTQSGYVHPFAEALRDFSIDPDATYTLLVEVRNCTMTGTGSFVVATGATYPWESNVSAVIRTGSYFYALSLTSKSSPNTSGLARFSVQTNSGKTECDVRLSIWKGVPSPSGYAPVGSICVHSVGENLADDSSGYHVGVSGSGIVAIADAYRSVICPLPPSESPYEVTVSRATVEGQYFRIYTTDAFPYATQATTTLYSGTTDLSKTVTVPASARWLIVVLDGSGATITSGNVKVQLGSTATAYEPYSGTSTPIDLQGNALRSLPDKDELTVDAGGNVTLFKRIGIHTFDGSETWTAYNGGGSLGYYFYTNLPDAEASQTRSTLLCSHCVGSTAVSPTKDMVTIGTTKNCIFAFGTTLGISTAADWKTWLASNPVTLLYKLATPQTISLGTITMPYIPDSSTVWVDAEVTPEIDVTIRNAPSSTTPATDSVDVLRVNADGSTWTVASNLADGDSCIDPLPPLGVPVEYRAVASAASGATATATFTETIGGKDWTLNFGNAAQESISMRYNPDASYSLVQGGASYHFADGGAGGGRPVFYPTTDRDESGGLKFATVGSGDADRLRALCDRYPVAWLRDPFGHRWRARVKPSWTHGVGELWPLSISWDAVRWEEAW